MTQKAAATTKAQTKRAQSAQTNSESMEKQIMGVPARIMRPRLFLIAITALLVCFGFVMIFSASSVEAISETGDAGYYVKRQIIFAAGGLLVAIAVANIDYHALTHWLWLTWLILVLLLLAVRLVGGSTNGASRWIQIGFFRLQPSEFAKPVIALAAANIVHQFYSERSINEIQFVTHGMLFVGVPVGLIIIQPDNGTVGIIGLMIYAILYYGGFPRDVLVRLFFFGVVVIMVVILTYPYARQRILTMIDPSSDPYDTGYQLNQGFIAFGSGGLFGVGIGMSRQKYSYLPEAHNDFIFAIIGEELGLVGTLFVVACFFFLVYEAIQIARQAPDLLGRLLVIGCITVIITQFFINAMGVLGLFPLSGKPMPFLSYGGSSIVSCLILIGLIVNVSKQSTLPDTVHDQRRRALTIAEDEDTGVGEAFVRGTASSEFDTGANNGRGAARRGSSVQLAIRPSRNSDVIMEHDTAPQSQRRQRSGGFSVLEGGKSAPKSFGSNKSSSGGYERINLGADPSERLRGSSGPKVHGSSKSSSSSSSKKRSKRK